MNAETAECARCTARTPIKRPLLVVPNQPAYTMPVGWSPFVFQRWQPVGIVQVNGVLCPACGDEFVKLLADRPCSECGTTKAHCDDDTEFDEQNGKCCEHCNHKPLPGGNDGQATAS